MTIKTMKTMTCALALTGLPLAGPLMAQEEASRMERVAQSEITEIWEPVPATVDTRGDVPSDAVVLFDGSGFDAWVPERGDAVAWEIDGEGAMTVAEGTGGIRTRENFCDMQLHVEWRSPAATEGFDGQDRGNSGIFLQERYEIQVLDSVDNPTYVNGQAGSIYKQHPPMVNASRGPGEWQSYDILFTAPVFGDGGQLRHPAHVTVLHNGVVVQNHAQIQGATEWIGAPSYSAHDCAPLFLQDHDAAVSYRNIWVRPL